MIKLDCPAARLSKSLILKFCFHMASSNVFVALYNKSLNDWSLEKQLILFPSNLNISLGSASGNFEILGK